MSGVSIDGRGASSCGSGCYTAPVASTRTVSVTHGRARVVFDLRDRGDATKLVHRAGVVFHALPGIAFVERLSSGTVAIESTWRQVAPNRLTYDIRGGAKAIIVGGRRWDRTPGAAWVESPQQPALSMPAPPWNTVRVQNARIVERTGGRVVLAFFDPQGGPAWFRLTADAKTLHPRTLTMVAPAHFMHHRYYAVGRRARIVPPR